MAHKKQIPWIKGRHHTLETRKKIGLASLGRTPSAETRLKKSLAKRGSKGSNWQGGKTKKNLIIRTSLKYKLWRERIFKRDEWTCVNCGEVGGKLNAHHIKGFSKYPKLRFDIDNGITLCKECHINIHKKIKNKNLTLLKKGV